MEDVHRYEKEMLKMMKDRHPEILKEIVDKESLMIIEWNDQRSS